jgi:L-amino acid N-acyltransferase YncA
VSPWIQRAKNAVQTVGWGRAAAAATLWPVSRRFLVLQRSLALPPVEMPPEPALEWELLTGAALRELTAVNPLLEPKEAERREREGMVCYGVRMGRDLVHYRWYATSAVWLPFLRLRWIPRAGEYAPLDIFTIPAARNARLHTRLSIEGIRRARELGFRRMVAFIAWWNVPSLTVTRRMGSEQIGSVTLWTLGMISGHTSSGSVSARDGELRTELE